MPIYNRILYFPEAIASIQRQTVDDWELILVDDGSSADILTPLQRFLEDKRIRLVRQENSGPSAARNRGVSEARAPWIAFLDDDDIWLPEKLQCHLDFINERPHIPFFFSDALMIQQNGHPLGSFQKKKGVIEKCAWFVGGGGLNVIPCGMEIDLSLSGFVLPSASVVKSSEFQLVGGFDENLRGGEDMDLVFRLSKNNQIGYIDYQLLHYRLTENSLSRNKLFALEQAEILYEKVKLYELKANEKKFVKNKQKDVRANLSYCNFIRNNYADGRRWALQALVLGWHPTAFIYGLCCCLPPAFVNFFKRFKGDV